MHAHGAVLSRRADWIGCHFSLLLLLEPCRLFRLVYRLYDGIRGMLCGDQMLLMKPFLHALLRARW